MLIDKFTSSFVGKKLRALRKRKGITSADLLADLMQGAYSPSGILRREEGRLKIDAEYLEKFCIALNLDSVEKNNLLTTARLDLWRSKRDLLQITKEFHALKLRANTHQKFMPHVIPGELQTASYAKAILLSYGDTEAIDERVQIRLDTGKQLLSDSTKKIQIVCAELAFYTPVGSIEIMIEQLSRLLKYTDTPWAEFRVLPRSVFLRNQEWEGFHIMDSLYCVCETRIGSASAEDDETTAEILNNFNEIWANALSGEQCKRLIKTAIKYYQSLPQDSSQTLTA